MNPPLPRFTKSAAELIEGDILDLRELIQIVRRRWKMILGVATMAIAVALLITINQTRLYTATSLILIETRENQVVNFEAVVSGLPADSATIESQVEILRSQALAVRVVNDLDLVNDPEFNGALVTEGASLLTQVNPLTWIASAVQFFRGPGAVDFDETLAAERERNAVVRSVQDRLQVRRRGLTYVIEINFTSEDPAKAARIANATADLYIVDQLEARFDATRRANDWLRDRLETLRDQVRVAELAAAHFAAENNLVSTGEVTVTEQQISQINAQLVTARADMAAARASYDRISQIVASGGSLEALNQIADTPSFARLREQQTTLRREEAELSSRYGDLHPELINVRQELREIDEQIVAEMNRVISTFGNEVEVARNRVRSLEQSLAEVTQDQTVANQAMIQLRELERTAESQRTLYETFLSRFNETRQQEDLQASDARVIAEATPPPGPSHPQPTVNLILGGMLGIAAGFGLALLIEWFDRGLRNREQIEACLGTPQLAAIPLLRPAALRGGGAGTRPEDFVIQKPLSAYAEAFRALKAAIALSNVDATPKTILVTSALPNEGKSTVALSLARHAAATGARTLLIDADLRHPQITQQIRGKDRNTKGLLNVLVGNASVKDVLYRDTNPNLFFVFGGTDVSNPADLLESSRMEKFVKEVGDEFDFVIFDSAPVLPVIDSRILSRLTDTTIFTVRWNDTSRDAAAEGVRELQKFGGRIAGTVVNMVNLDRQRLYGYGGGSQFYYGEYRHYYTE